MTFGNPVAGGETLIRSALKSPNYQKGLIGWAINSDGSAEFNNISVSSGSVDTSAGASTGVKIYNSDGNPGSGTVEWDAYNSALKATLGSSQTGSGGTDFAMALSGTTGPQPGPEFDINCEELAAGGYHNIFRFKNADTVDMGGAAITGVLHDTNGWQRVPMGSDYLYYLVKGGWCSVHAWVLYSNGWAASTLAATLPAGARPSAQFWVPSNISGDSTRWCLTLFNTDGSVTLMPAVAGSNDVRIAFAFPVA